MDNDNDNFHYAVARPENLTTDNIGNLHQRQQPHISETVTFRVGLFGKL